MFSSVLGHIKGFISNESKCDIKEDNTIKSCNMSSNLEDDELKNTIFELLRTIRDPEKPATLEALNVVFEDGITVSKSVDDCLHLVTVEFHPTVSHCSLATLIGLCIRVKLRRNLLENYKLDVYLKKGTHNTEDEVNKQINDKERVAAAMENQSLRELVELCIKEEE